MAKKKKRPILSPGWAIYLRTSDEDAQAPERSQTSQRRLIVERLVSDTNLPIVAEYKDTYTGRASDRKQYQQLLADARLGKFSHVGIAFVDRFGRNDVEGIRAFDELIDLGITVRVATYPNLDPATSDGRMIVGMLFTVARFESDRIGERCREGMRSKLLDGGWAWRAPDGYVNKEMKSNLGSKADKIQNARYKRWIEPHPEQSKVWRQAWDLLLKEQKTLDEICEILHGRGYTLRSGSPFIYFTKSGLRKTRANALSRAFHNWFYAGWVVADTDWVRIPPKEVRGNWEPLVSTEEFEAGLSILEDRKKNRIPKRKHFYLLQSRLYLERENGKLVKLTCSTPNTRRKGGGTPYYCIPSSSSNFLCADIDAQIPEWFERIQVDEDEIPALQDAYLTQLESRLGRPDARQQKAMEAALKSINDEEMRAARLYAAGRISDDIWDTLWREWNDRRAAIKQSLEALNTKYDVYVEDLGAALALIAKLGILYTRLDRHAQQKVLRLVVNRVIIDATGTIIKMELRPPFTYLHALRHGGDNGRGKCADQGKTKTSSQKTACSMYTSFGAPKGSRHHIFSTHSGRDRADRLPSGKRHLCASLCQRESLFRRGPASLQSL